MDVYAHMNELGIHLDQAIRPSGLYHSCERFLDGKLLYTSGVVCRKGDVPVRTGKVGREVSLEDARMCARQCALNLLAILEQETGDLNRIKKVVKLLGFVASEPDFLQQPNVINGASQLLADVFGERGVGARSAVGVAVLPNDVPVEIEMLVELA